ncbi:MAG: 5-dehydro-4-deoxy-D-glucuronate isomerase [Bacteroidales bacterium]
MINSEFRYAISPTEGSSLGTGELRKNFLIENLFVKDSINLTYSMYDRLIVGGAMPVNRPIVLESIEYLKKENFLDRRELGIINVGGKGIVCVDQTDYELDKKEALYIGQGCKEVVFKSKNGEQPLFYFNSAPAHRKCATKKIGLNDAVIVELGETKFANKRRINKLIINGLVETCQLQMGLTELLPGSVWNTMPPHSHARRMEAYFYFDLAEDQAVCHLMGEPMNTRHIFINNNQAVLSPEWSIHSGVGTTNYSFIWGMAGENLEYDDMDSVKPFELK